MSGLDRSDLGGWVDDPRAVAEVVGRMAEPVLGLACSRSFLATTHRDVFLWDAEVKLFGNTLPAHEQTIGDCVSHGWARGVQDLVFQEYARQPGVIAIDDCDEIATEPIYALSRVEVGRGRLGNGDGSIGAWAAEAGTKYGYLQRRKYLDRYDLTKYSGALARKWGSPREGLPDDLEPIARKYPVAKTPLVVTDDEALSALYNSYPIPICSGQGFTTTRDKYGFCDPRGSWAHCMVVRGVARVRRASSVVLAGFVQQSWGQSPGGPNTITLETGEERKLPQGVFAVEFDVIVSRILRNRDSFAPAGPQGFIERAPIYSF